MNKKEKYQSLIFHLKENSNKLHPILSEVLEMNFMLKGSEVRDIIRKARREGIPIVGTDRGYYYGTSVSDVKIITDDMLDRIKSMSKTINLLSTKFGFRFQLEFKFVREIK